MKPKRTEVARYPRAEIAAVENFIQEHNGEFTKRGLAEQLSRTIARETVEDIIGFLLYRHKIHVDRRSKINWVLGSVQASKWSRHRSATGNAPDHRESRMRETWSKREEANAITCFTFRNGFLEELHAGKYSELLENSELSRITDAEMKRLMIEASQKMAELMTMKEKEPDKYWRLISSMNEKYCKKWDK